MTQSPPVAPIGRGRSTYASRAEDAIRAMITDGRLAPGTRVNEVELAESLQISRGPLREAIQRLATQGLLTTRSHHGAYVAEISADELRDLYDLRAALETHAVRAIALDEDPTAHSALRDLLTRTKKLLRARKVSGEAYHLDFHHALIELAGNAAISRVHGEVLQQIALARSRASGHQIVVRHALEQHVLVLEPLIEGDGEAAVQALAEHLASSRDQAVGLIAPMNEASQAH